jgi:hypothetical protein
MLLRWTQNISDPEEKAAFEASVLGSKIVLDRLLTMLNEDEAAIGRSETDVGTFDIPNWPYLQAYKNGQRACIANLKRMVDLDQ